MGIKNVKINNNYLGMGIKMWNNTKHVLEWEDVEYSVTKVL